MSPKGRENNLEKTRALAARAKKLIPAGCHTYSKGDDQFPSNAPQVIVRGEGCNIWDADGNQYLDYGMGLRSVILGHAYPRVIEAAKSQLPLGSNFTRPSALEGDLAELLVDLIPSAEMVKFCKNGSDVTAAAVRMARAYTGRDIIAKCGDNPFFSFEDWFIGKTPCNSGVPESVSALTVDFAYNDIASLEKLFDQYKGRIACVILEPVSTEAPKPGYLEQVKDVAHKNGAVLIFDEIISGFRWHLKGAQEKYKVTPDLSTFGKAIGNGFSVSALVGKREIMELGGTDHKKERVFLLSATHGGETHALAAAIATIQEMKEKDVVGHLWTIGGKLQDGINAAAKSAGIADRVGMHGFPCSPYIILKGEDGKPSQELRTLFLQEMVKDGILIPYVALSYSHTLEDVKRTVSACERAFGVVKKAIEHGVGDYLVGPVCKPVWRRYN